MIDFSARQHGAATKRERVRRMKNPKETTSGPSGRRGTNETAARKRFSLGNDFRDRNEAGLTKIEKMEVTTDPRTTKSERSGKGEARRRKRS